MNKLPLLPHVDLQVESGGWVRGYDRRPELNGLTGRELLARSRDLPANSRFGRDATGVLLVADEFASPNDGPVAAELRLLCWLQGECDNETEMADEELIESLLAERSLACTRRDENWIVPPADDRGVELVVGRVTGGVRVQGVLADVTEAKPAAVEALAEFLCRTHRALRFVRAELDESQARFVSQAPTSRLETELLHSLQAVATATRLLLRESQALLKPELAEAYLRIVQ